MPFMQSGLWSACCDAKNPPPFRNMKRLLLLALLAACEAPMLDPGAIDAARIASGHCPPGHAKRGLCDPPPPPPPDTTPPPPDTTTPPPPGSHVGWYVSPDGSGDGSASNPWSLQHALSHPAIILPGDTIWVRGGVYRGDFRSLVDGTSNAPIIVRAYPGERATIDTNGQFLLDGSTSHVWFWGLEFMSSDPDRTSDQTGSQPTDITRRSSRVEVRSSVGVRFINVIVHDLGNGIGWWVGAVDSEIHGAVIYNNGWQAPDRGHGHGIYSQNRDGWKEISDTFSFNNYAMGAQIYGSEAAYVWNYRLTGNVMFNPGSLSPTGATRTMIVGLSNSPVGRYGADNIEVAHNVMRGVTPDHVAISLGYGSQNGTLTLGPGNVWLSRVEVVGWQTVIGSVSPAPTGLQVIVRPNKYEAGRANVIVVNPGMQASVTVDLSGVLQPGQAFEVRNAQDYYAAPVVSGTYSGPVSLPMTGLSVAQPIGNAPKAAVPTGAGFNAFVVRGL